MAQSITLTKTDYDRLLDRVTQLETMVNTIVQSVSGAFEKEPPYGSAAWWKWSDKKAKEDFANGDFYTLSNKKELSEFLLNARKGNSNEHFHNRVRF